MPRSNQYDAIRIDNLTLSYDAVTKELSPAPRLTEGENIWAAANGALRLRPGVTAIANTPLAYPIHRLHLLTTAETTPKIYILASAKNGSVWEMFYLRLNQPNPSWQSMGSYRGLNASSKPHEICIARGMAFIKSFPASGESLGTVIFDGSVKPWGLPAPTQPARITAKSGWAGSTDPVKVLYGWKYVYCWKSVTGHYSCRSPLETSPAENPSDTGAFENKKPSIIVRGHADTANIPKISIFRTTDGGGTFYWLEDIDNVGDQDITYTDQRREPGNTNNPKTDFQLDTANVAPSLTSNLPPPAALPGQSGIQHSTPIVYFAGRLWYAIKNRVYFSSREEALNGVPEETWKSPNGIRGNYYVLPGEVTHFASTASMLYIFTTHGVYGISGYDLTTFRVSELSKISAAVGQPRAVAVWRETVLFLTADYRVAAIKEDAASTVSYAISGQIQPEAEDTISFCTHQEGDNEWLLILKQSSGGNRVFVYDLLKQIWNTPWTIQATALASGHYHETASLPRLVVAHNSGSLGYLDETVSSDLATAYGCSLVFGPITIPAGNHVNLFRLPAAFPVVNYIVCERKKFPNDTDPVVAYRLDEFSGSWNTPPQINVPFTQQRVSHKAHWYPVKNAAQRVQIKISKPAVNEPFELHAVTVIFDPEAGA